MSCTRRGNCCTRSHAVRALTALAFVLSCADPSHFAKSRQVGPYLMLVSATDQSGKSDPQKRISKHGNELTMKEAAGQLRPLRARSFRRGLRPQASRRKDRREGRKEHQETRGGGGSEKVLGAVAPSIDYGRGLRTAVQREPSRVPSTALARCDTEC